QRRRGHADTRRHRESLSGLDMLPNVLRRRPLDEHGAEPVPGQMVDDEPASGTGRNRAVPPEVLRQVRLLELRTRGLVNSLFTGEYRSVFKGQGMEFAEVRK